MRAGVSGDDGSVSAVGQAEVKRGEDDWGEDADELDALGEINGALTDFEGGAVPFGFLDGLSDSDYESSADLDVPGARTVGAFERVPLSALPTGAVPQPVPQRNPPGMRLSPRLVPRPPPPPRV